jgi:hypothetical protein
MAKALLMLSGGLDSTLAGKMLLGLGNLGNSLAAQAAQAGLRCFIFMPADLEQGKIVGTSIFGVHVVGIAGNYDAVNRLCSEIADRYGWGFVNINLRPYYAEGSKTFAFETVEQLGWRAPAHVVVPMAGEDIRLLQGLDTTVHDGDTVTILSAIAGGAPAAVARRFWLTFPRDLVGRPLLWEVGHCFEVVTNVRQASVTDEIGLVGLEITGEENEVERAVAFLVAQGVTVEPIELGVVE